MSGSYTNTFHTTGLADKCVECHFDANTSGHQPKHDFEPATATCNRCHGVSTFNRPGFGDWDDDGTTEGVQDEVRGLLVEVETALVDNATIWRDGEYFVDTDPASLGYSQSTALKLLKPAVSDAQRRAVFNWYTVEFDGSFGVHNAQRSMQLLQRSWEEVTGKSWPSAKRR